MKQIEEYSNLKQVFTKWKQNFLIKADRRDRLLEELHKKQEELRKLEEKSDLLEQVRILLQNTSEYAREQARQQIEILVTHALEYVFGLDIQFKIELKEVRGRTEADFFVKSTYGDYIVETRPQDARGGGIVDVISLALRIAMLQAFQPKIMGPLILDEPAKHVSEEYIGGVAQFLKYYCDMFSRQVIMITHNHQLSEVADKVFLIELKQGKSIVTPYTSA
ncbi:MAG TPA: ATPase [Clostridia bacterium]|nr:ATPase [Clostridia bacterium]